MISGNAPLNVYVVVRKRNTREGREVEMLDIKKQISDVGKQKQKQKTYTQPYPQGLFSLVDI